MKKPYLIIILLTVVLTGEINAQFITRADSIITFTPENKVYKKVINDYDSDNKLICEVTQYRNEGNTEWINSEKREYYSPTHTELPITVNLPYTLNYKTHIWDKDVNKWIMTHHNYYEYDANNDSILIYIKFQWNNEKLINGNKTVNIVDLKNGIVLKEKYYLYNIVENKWNDKEISLFEYIYNKNLKLLSQIYYRSNSYYSIKSVTTYNSAGDIALQESFQKEVDSDIWEITDRTTYDYNSDNQLTLQESEYTEAGSWIKSSKTVNNYNTNGVLLSTIKYKWNKDIANWIGVSNLTSEFSNNGYTLTRMYYTWDTDDSDWAPDNRSVVNYSNTKQVLNKKSYSYYKYYENKTHFEYEKSAYIYHYDENDNLIKYERYERDHTNLTSYDIYYYTNAPQSINSESNSTDVSAYYVGSNLIVDSPVSEIVEVYSLSGKLIYRQNKEAGKTALNIGRQAEPIIAIGTSGWTKKLY